VLKIKSSIDWCQTNDSPESVVQRERGVKEIANAGIEVKHCKFNKNPCYPVHTDSTVMSDLLLESLLLQEPSVTTCCKMNHYNIKQLFFHAYMQITTLGAYS